MKKFIIFIFTSLLFLGCSQEKKEVDKSQSDTTQTKKEVKKDSTSNWAKELNEVNAKLAANNLLKKDNSNLAKWNDLIKFSDYEIRGSAIINKMVKVSYIDHIGTQPLPMIGEFIFRKDVNDYWIINEVHFRNYQESGFNKDNSWNETVFIRVVN